MKYGGLRYGNLCINTHTHRLRGHLGRARRQRHRDSRSRGRTSLETTGATDSPDVLNSLLLLWALELFAFPITRRTGERILEWGAAEADMRIVHQCVGQALGCPFALYRICGKRGFYFRAGG